MGQEKRGRGQRVGGRRVGISATPPETQTKQPTPPDRRARMQGMQDPRDRETVVLPLVTLPTIPAMPRQGTNEYGQYEENGGYEPYGAYAGSEYGIYPETEYEAEYGAHDGWDQEEGQP